jgi:hypothetical protein
MAAVKASVNLFALLDGDDPGDNRLDDFDPQHKDQPKKKPVTAASCDYKLKLMKQPSPPAQAARSKAPMKNPTPGVPAGLRSAAVAPKKNPTTAVAAGLRSGAAASVAKSMNKQTTTPVSQPAARNTNLTGVLFAYPSARERIFKQRQERQEEYERRQAKMAENDGSVSGDNDGKSGDAGAPSAVERTGKTHGVKVQKGGGQYYYDGARNQPVVPVKKAPVPVTEVPAVAPVVLKTPPPPPSVDDIVQFPSLK